MIYEYKLKTCRRERKFAIHNKIILSNSVWDADLKQGHLSIFNLFIIVWQKSLITNNIHTKHAK